MGGSYFADENGVLAIELRDSDGNVVSRVHLMNLDPGEEVYEDIIHGSVR